MFSLPIPKHKDLSHSQTLLEHILSEINANHGKISFAQYMDLALYTPGLGYYSGGKEKFGNKGDFTTAPEISSLFSRCLARQCEEVLTQLGTGDILEIGAGSGQMAADILIALAKSNALPNHYYILEVSAELKHRQQEKVAALCPEFLSRIEWLTTLPKTNFTGIILANEVLDAMPVHRFHITESQIKELDVTAENDHLKSIASATEKPALLELYHSQNWSTPYISEINLNLKPWILSLSSILQAGIILLIDYGFPRKEYYHQDRNMGTLMCHYHHHAHPDPFLYPGLQDITAHVDFTAIAEAGMLGNLELLGFTHQAAFLLSCGLLELAEKNNVLTEKEKAIQNQAIQMLTSPAKMGELFKVIALGRKTDMPLLGFHLLDRRYTL